MTDEVMTRGSGCLVDGVLYTRVQGLGQANPCNGCAAHPDTHEPGLCTQLGHCGYDIWVRSATQDDSEGVGDTITSPEAFAPHHGDPTGPRVEDSADAWQRKHDGVPAKAYKPTHGGYPG